MDHGHAGRRPLAHPRRYIDLSRSETTGIKYSALCTCTGGSVGRACARACVACVCGVQALLCCDAAE